MLVWATRNAWFLFVRVLVLAALFVVVVVLHLAVTGALRELGLQGGLALTISGAAVLALVLLLLGLRDWLSDRFKTATEVRRMKAGLPSGPCCVVWRASVDAAPGDDDDGMDWDVVGPLRARYPRLARRLNIEGVAIAEFEVSAEGRAKNIHCVDAWPSDLFFTAAREALEHARFTLKPDVHARFGQSYRMPFVFRISGAARLRDSGRRARKLRPRLQAAQQAVENLRHSA
jgi:TonB family protein